MDELAPQYTCPCCGYRMFRQAPGNYEICSICFWEDDLGSLERADEREGGPNKVSLVEAQRNFDVFGACEEEFAKFTRKPGPFDEKDPAWRPWDPAVDRAFAERLREEGFPEELTALYYWRSSRR